MFIPPLHLITPNSEGRSCRIWEGGNGIFCDVADFRQLSVVLWVCLFDMLNQDNINQVVVIYSNFPSRSWTNNPCRVILHLHSCSRSTEDTSGVTKGLEPPHFHLSLGGLKYFQFPLECNSNSKTGGKQKGWKCNQPKPPFEFPKLLRIQIQTHDLVTHSMTKIHILQSKDYENESA